MWGPAPTGKYERGKGPHVINDSAHSAGKDKSHIIKHGWGWVYIQPSGQHDAENCYQCGRTLGKGSQTNQFVHRDKPFNEQYCIWCVEEIIEGVKLCKD